MAKLTIIVTQLPLHSLSIGPARRPGTSRVESRRFPPRSGIFCWFYSDSDRIVESLCNSVIRKITIRHYSQISDCERGCRVAIADLPGAGVRFHCGLLGCCPRVNYAFTVKFITLTSCYRLPVISRTRVKFRLASVPKVTCSVQQAYYSAYYNVL